MSKSKLKKAPAEKAPAEKAGATPECSRITPEIRAEARKEVYKMVDMYFKHMLHHKEKYTMYLKDRTCPDSVNAKDLAFMEEEAKLIKSFIEHLDGLRAQSS